MLFLTVLRREPWLCGKVIGGAEDSNPGPLRARQVPHQCTISPAHLQRTSINQRASVETYLTQERLRVSHAGDTCLSPRETHCNSNLLQGHWEDQRARQCWVTLLPKPLRTPGWTKARASANNVAWTAQAGGERQSEPRTTVSSLTTHPSPKLPPPGACGFHSFLHPHSPSPHQLALFPRHRTKIS